jgi:hypothetical protein
MGWYQNIVHDPYFQMSPSQSQSKWGRRLRTAMNGIEKVGSRIQNIRNSRNEENRRRKIRRFGINTYKKVYGWLRRPRPQQQQQQQQQPSYAIGVPFGYHRPSNGSPGTRPNSTKPLSPLPRLNIMSPNNVHGRPNGGSPSRVEPNTRPHRPNNVHGGPHPSNGSPGTRPNLTKPLSPLPRLNITNKPSQRFINNVPGTRSNLNKPLSNSSPKQPTMQYLIKARNSNNKKTNKIEEYTGLLNVIFNYLGRGHVWDPMGLTGNQRRKLDDFFQRKMNLVKISKNRFNGSFENEAKKFSDEIETFYKNLENHFKRRKNRFPKSSSDGSLANAFKTIGVTRNNTKKNANWKYKKLALIHHPDKGGNHEMVQKIRNAWDRLRNIDNKDWNAIKSNVFSTR